MRAQAIRSPIPWLALLCVACLGRAERPSLDGFQGQMLLTRDAPGMTCLQGLQDSFEPVRAWTAREGVPDYVLFESRRSIALFYIQRDQTVRFERPWIGGALSARPSQPIRSDHHVLFTNSDRERLARIRMGDAPRPEPSRRDVLRRRVGSEDQQGASSAPQP
jgi:hypothetical protein